MNKSIGFGVPVVVFLFIILSGDALGQAQQQLIVPTIVVSQSTGRPQTISFTNSELQLIEREPRVLLKRLGTITTRDCTTPYRISNCIWACRNTRKVRTCHPTLLRALERVWRGESKAALELDRSGSSTLEVTKCQS